MSLLHRYFPKGNTYEDYYEPFMGGGGVLNYLFESDYFNKSKKYM